MAFDSGTTNAGSGGLTLAVNTFTDSDAVARTAPFSQLAFGVMDAIPTIVSASNGLPVAQQGTWNVGTVTTVSTVSTVTTVGAVTAITNALPAGSNVIGGVTQSGTWTVAATVSGVATAANQATEIASLASIDGKIPALGQALAAASVPVILPAATITTLTPPAAITGFATSAKQDTAQTALDAINGKITAVDTGAVVVSSSALPSGASTAAKQPALGTAGTASADVITVQGIASMTALKVDGSAVTQPVSGTFWQATQPVSVASVPSHDVTNAGTFAVQATGTVTANIGTSGSLATAANQATVIGHVDGIETLLGTIDADTGNISTKIDTLAGAVSGTEFQVDVLTMPTVTVNAHAVTNAGTFVVQENGAALTALQLIDDTVTTLGTDTYTEATSKGIAIGAVRRDADTTLVNTTNEFGPLQMDANGRLKVEAFSGETLPVSLTSTTVTGTVAVTQSGTWDEVGINDSGNSITVDNGGTFAVQVDGTALTRLTDIETNTDSGAVIGNGAAATAQRVTLANDSTGIVALTTSTASIGKLASNTGVTIGAVEIAAAQTLATVTTVSTVTTCSTVTTLTGGGVAHGSADSGNPIKVGSKAFATLSTATLVAAADRTDQVSDLDGAIIVRDSATAADYVSGRATNTDGTSTQCLAAAGSGVKIYLTDVALANSSATAITVDIKDGTTVKWTFPVPAGAGVVFSFKTPLVGTANTAWNFDGSAAATMLSCSMSGFKSKI